MALPVPTSLTLNFGGSCNQMTCCSSNVSNSSDNHSVVYNPADQELTTLNEAGCGLFRLFTLCCPPKPTRREREETLQAVNIYLINTHGVTLEEAAKACEMPIGKKTVLKVKELKALEEAAKSLPSSKLPTQEVVNVPSTFKERRSTLV